MNTQLSLFDEPARNTPKTYIRERNGRFATKEKAEFEKYKREAEYYRFMFEAEQRKMKPILDQLFETQRKLQSLNNN